MIRIRDLAFSYKEVSNHDTDSFRLEIKSFGIAAGESTALVGPSGSGKSTLLGLIAGILRPNTGTVMVNGRNICELSDRALGEFRVNTVGQVFQSFELLDYLSILENVMLPWFIEGHGKKVDTHTRAIELLTDVGLETGSSSYPGELSQGEKQRVAVCRAMLNFPSLLLADEPTGNLDRKNKQNVVNILLDQAHENASTLLMVTHDESLLERFDTVQDIRAVTGTTVREVSA